MEPADSIRRLGFLRWYERRLIEGHAWLVSGIACMIAIAACMEELSFRGSYLRLFAYLLVIIAASLTGIYGFVRYQRTLAEAERIGAHATCARCGTYGRFTLISPLSVRCRKCGHEWRLIH